MVCKELVVECFPACVCVTFAIPSKHCFDNRTLIIFVNALVFVNFFIALQSGAILHYLTLPNFKDLQGVQNFAGRIIGGSEKHTVVSS